MCFNEIDLAKSTRELFVFTFCIHHGASLDLVETKNLYYRPNEMHPSCTWKNSDIECIATRSFRTCLSIAFVSTSARYTRQRVSFVIFRDIDHSFTERAVKNRYGNVK